MATAPVLRRVRRLMCSLAVTLAFVLAMPGAGAAAGPWQAQIVDAETGQPLEGVVVLFSWLKMTRTLGGPSPDFHDASEVATDLDGRFTISARSHVILNPFQYIDGPRVVIFKPGYGQWRVRAGLPPSWQKDEDLTTGDIFARQGIVLELPPLKTREARLKFYRSFRDIGLTPGKYMQRLVEAQMMERRYLGLGN